MTALLFFVLEVLCGVVAIACLLRFLFQVAQVNTMNNVVVSTRRLTDTFLNPFRSVLPHGRYVDTASLFVAWIAMSVRLWIQAAYSPAGQAASAQDPSTIELFLAVIWVALVRLFQYSIWIFIATILIGVILSWVAPNTVSPYAQLARQMPAFLLQPVQRFLPSLGGLDFSPAIVLLALTLLNSRMVPWLYGLFA